MLENKYWIVDCFSVSEADAAGISARATGVETPLAKDQKQDRATFFVLHHDCGTLDTRVVTPIL